MDTHTVFCSGCDRNVVIVARREDWRVAVGTGEFACLERGVRCSGTMCPFCADRPRRAERAVASRRAAEATLDAPFPG